MAGNNITRRTFLGQTAAGMAAVAAFFAGAPTNAAPDKFAAVRKLSEDYLRVRGSYDDAIAPVVKTIEENLALETVAGTAERYAQVEILRNAHSSLIKAANKNVGQLTEILAQAYKSSGGTSENHDLLVELLKDTDAVTALEVKKFTAIEHGMAQANVHYNRLAPQIMAKMESLGVYEQDFEVAQKGLRQEEKLRARTFAELEEYKNKQSSKYFEIDGTNIFVTTKADGEGYNIIVPRQTRNNIPCESNSEWRQRTEDFMAHLVKDRNCRIPHQSHNNGRIYDISFAEKSQAKFLDEILNNQKELGINSFSK